MLQHTAKLWPHEFATTFRGSFNIDSYCIRSIQIAHWYTRWSTRFHYFHSTSLQWCWAKTMESCWSVDLISNQVLECKTKNDELFLSKTMSQTMTWYSGDPSRAYAWPSSERLSTFARNPWLHNPRWPCYNVCATCMSISNQYESVGSGHFQTAE